MEKCNIYNCNIYTSQKYIKHKWIPIIVFVISKDIHKFNEILNNIEFVTNAQLSLSLNILVDEYLLNKKDNGYFFTDKGLKLLEIIKQMQAL